MTQMGKSSDASFYYYQDTSANVARMDSSAVYGNLADAMKDATVIFASPHFVEITGEIPVYGDSTQNKPTEK